MDARHYNGSDDREFSRPPEDRHWLDEPCECHCEHCGAPLELSPYSSKVYARCGECFGGEAPDGEAWRGREAAASEAEQMVIARRLK